MVGFLFRICRNFLFSGARAMLSSNVHTVSTPLQAVATLRSELPRRRSTSMQGRPVCPEGPGL